jgi:hypothetical protein
MQHLATIRVLTPNPQSSSGGSHSSRQLVSLSTSSSQIKQGAQQSGDSSHSPSTSTTEGTSPEIKHVTINGFEGIDEDFSPDSSKDSNTAEAPPSPADPTSEKLFAKAKPSDVLIRHRGHFGWFLDFLQWVGVLPPTWHDQYVPRSTAHSAPRVAYPLWWAAPFLSGTGKDIRIEKQAM